MYKLLKIGNKEYKLEYSIEASLYDECVKSVMNTLLATSGGVDKTPEEMISGMANIPNTALTVFYAGLLQYHGDSQMQTVLSRILQLQRDLQCSSFRNIRMMSRVTFTVSSPCVLTRWRKTVFSN